MNYEVRPRGGPQAHSDKTLKIAYINFIKKLILSITISTHPATLSIQISYFAIL